MSHDSREKSWELGEPVEYYDFIRDKQHWRYNTSDRDIIRIVMVDDEPVEQIWIGNSNISRENIRQGAERNRLLTSFNLPRALPVADLWHPYPTSQSVGLTVYSGHVGEDDPDVVWIGRVTGPRFKADTLTLVGEPTTTLARKSGQIQSWQRGCMHVLYKQGLGLCNADRDEFGVPATIAFSLANLVSAPEFATYETGRFAGGYIEWETEEGSIERRSISAHTGQNITLFYGTTQLPVGTEVIAYPGCRHNWSDCNDFFDNGENYGGDLYAPERSPFNGNPVF